MDEVGFARVIAIRTSAGGEIWAFALDRKRLNTELRSKLEGFLEDLQYEERDREFVGTNSRFRDIFFRLKEMIEQSNDNAEARVEELQRKKWAIENEINLIRNGKAPTVYDDTEIKERFFDLNKSARELLSDFTEVEQNFEQIRKDIQRKYTEKDVAKGAILVLALDGRDEIESKFRKSISGIFPTKSSFFANFSDYIGRFAEFFQLNLSFFGFFQINNPRHQFSIPPS